MIRFPVKPIRAAPAPSSADKLKVMKEILRSQQQKQQEDQQRRHQTEMAQKQQQMEMHQRQQQMDIQQKQHQMEMQQKQLEQLQRDIVDLRAAAAKRKIDEVKDTKKAPAAPRDAMQQQMLMLAERRNAPKAKRARKMLIRNR